MKNDKATASICIRLWVLGSVFVVPLLALEFQFLWIAVWVSVGAVLGCWWTWRHKLEPDEPEKKMAVIDRRD